MSIHELSVNNSDEPSTSSQSEYSISSTSLIENLSEDKEKLNSLRKSLQVMFSKVVFAKIRQQLDLQDEESSDDDEDNDDLSIDQLHAVYDAIVKTNQEDDIIKMSLLSFVVEDIRTEKPATESSQKILGFLPRLYQYFSSQTKLVEQEANLKEEIHNLKLQHIEEINKYKNSIEDFKKCREDPKPVGSTIGLDEELKKLETQINIMKTIITSIICNSNADFQAETQLMKIVKNMRHPFSLLDYLNSLRE